MLVDDGEERARMDDDLVADVDQVMSVDEHGRVNRAAVPEAREAIDLGGSSGPAEEEPPGEARVSRRSRDPADAAHRSASLEPVRPRLRSREGAS